MSRAGAWAVFVLATWAPSVAAAHGLLRASSPAANAALAESPSEVRLTFTEAPERRFTTITIIAPGGVVTLGGVRILAGNTAVAALPSRLAPGRYRVRWQTAGADGHPVSGEYAFSVAAPAVAADSLAATIHDPGAHPQVPPHGVSAGASGEEAFAAFGAILRWLTLIGAITTLGVVAFRATVITRVSRELDLEIATQYLPTVARRAALIGVLASVVVLLAAVARLLVQSFVMHGRARALDPSVLGPMLADTTWGNAWLLQVAASLLALVAFVLVRGARHRAWVIASMGAVGLAIGLALASHAAIVPRWSTASIIANVIHTIAASGWLGNLFLIFLVGLPLAWRLDRDDRWVVVRDIVYAFSPAALAFGAIAGATGVFLAWTHVGSFGALTGTDYGRVLLLKLGLLSVTALTGAYNWLRVRPALGDERGARRLRRSSGVELGIAGLVLAVTAVLVALPTPQQ